MTPPLRSFAIDRLTVEIYPDRTMLGRAAALAAGEALGAILQRQSGARIVFACAPSQNESLTILTSLPEIAWERVTAFHMDEYLGLPGSHPASFRRYLRDHVTSKVNLAEVHELIGDAPDARAECERYENMLRSAPIDLVLLGIGENGHLAFNDPPVADFNDPRWVKCVELDEACRRQQVNDGCFSTLKQVPRHALTLTIPALLSAARMFCIVPGQRKAAAVKAALKNPPSSSCPASALRAHRTATLFLDVESAAGLG